MSNFYFAKVNEDGSYSEPIEAKVTDFEFSAGIKEERKILFNAVKWEEESIETELDYKSTKEFVWTVILNLKRSKKRFVTKNLIKEGD